MIVTFRGFYKERAHIAADPYSARICATCRLVKTVDQVLETGLAVSSLVLVDDALGDSLVEQVIAMLHRGVGSLGVGGGDGSLDLLDGGLELRLDGLVAQTGLLGLLVALDLGLDVSH